MYSTLVTNLIILYSLYQNELDSSCYQNQRLGLGIAGFQALSNLSLNGKC